MPRIAAWSQDEQEAVAGLLSIGLSYVAIAAQLHISKGAVAGRVSRHPELRVYVGKAKPMLPHRKPPKLMLLQCVETTGVLLVELPARGCKWPVAETDRGHLFCGKSRLGDWTPYCGEHSARARP
jgi:hypothetical protein